MSQSSDNPAEQLLPVQVVQSGGEGRADLRSHREAKGALTWRLALAVFACVSGASFQFGFQTGVLNNPQQLLQDEYKYRFGDYNRSQSLLSNDTGSHNVTLDPRVLSDSDVTIYWSLTVAVFAVGGMIAGFAGSYVATYLGRKKLMLWNNVILAVGVALMVSTKYAKLYQLMIAGRFFMGLTCGFSTVVAPLYLTEISPVHLRGGIGTVNQLGITLGIVLSQMFGLSSVLGSVELYQWIFVIPAIAAAVQLIILPFCPESPSWLFIDCDDQNASKEALVWLRGSDSVSAELSVYLNEVNEKSGLPKRRMREMFTESWLRTPLIIALVLQLSQQLSGIIPVLFYSTSIFISAKLAKTDAQYATVGTTSVIVLMTFISMLFMDRVGRRPLHLIGLSGMLVMIIVLTVSLLVQHLVPDIKYLCIVCVVLVILFFAVGPGSIPWFITAELFDQSSRPYAVSLATVVNWAANFVAGMLFPIMQGGMGYYCFLPYIVLLLIFIIFTFFKVPETKNKSTEEIVAFFKGKSSASNPAEATKSQQHTDAVL